MLAARSSGTERKPLRENMLQKNDLNIGLVLLAAGFGTRFGGNKQLSAIGPENTIIMDYTIYDAWRIGYSWVTVILREEIVGKFEEEVGKRWRDKIELRYSIQSTESYIPDTYRIKTYVAGRRKPWGTAHALLCAAEQVDGPFAVANADDFYGYHGLKEIFFYLRQTVLTKKQDTTPASLPSVLPQAMVGFQLGRTLSENGAVARGICHTYRDSRGQELLENIQEHTQLIRGGDLQIRSLQGECGEGFILPEDTPVSMNLFGLQEGIFSHLQQQFESFLQNLNHSQNPEEAAKREFYLPSAVESLLEEQKSTVAMLHSSDPWFGLTYLADLPVVRGNIADLIREGKYPGNLFATENSP
ncbi:MAG: nucleotidyltransferase [Spirochaetota bacterium]